MLKNKKLMELKYDELVNAITLVKEYGDLSAHNRRFFAKKSDMNVFKFEMRQVVQEIIFIIDYKNWDRET